MATISSVGIGSGLDVNSMVSKLVELEKAPLTSLKSKASVLNAQMSAVGTIKSQISGLADAAFNLVSDTAWNALAATSSDGSAVGVAISGSPAKASYSFEVQQLAKSQSTASAALTAGTNVGTGSLSIQLGTWSSGFGAFTPGAAAAVNITIGVGEDTLTSIATKINDANAGVTATVSTDASGERLMIRSNATGEAKGFRIQVTDADTTNTNNTGLSRLGFDPAAGAFGMGTTIGTAVQAQDAKALLNNVPTQSSTNTFSGLVPGLTLTAAKVTTTPVTVEVIQDTAAIKANIQAFVNAYNKLNATLSDATKYDTSTKSGSLFQGDSVVTGLQNALRRVVTSATTGAAYGRLSDIGVTMQRDGSLQVDAKLDTALSDVAAVKKFFTIDNSGTTDDGFGLKLKAFTNGLLAAGGTVDSKSKAIQSNLSTNTQRQQKVTDHANTVEARLRAQYSALDGKMAGLTALGNYVNQQVTLWNKNTA